MKKYELIEAIRNSKKSIKQIGETSKSIDGINDKIEDLGDKVEDLDDKIDEIIDTIPTKLSDLENDLPEATESESGLMSSEDKTKLNGIEEGAQKNVVPDWSKDGNTYADGVKNRTHWRENVQYIEGTYGVLFSGNKTSPGCDYSETSMNYEFSLKTLSVKHERPKIILNNDELEYVTGGGGQYGWGGVYKIKGDTTGTNVCSVTGGWDKEEDIYQRVTISVHKDHYDENVNVNVSGTIVKLVANYHKLDSNYIDTDIARTEELDEVKQIAIENLTDYICSNSEMTTSFEHQSEMYAGTGQCLEAGPWYKDGVQCDGTNKSVDKYDYAIVQKDETLFYFVAHRFKYERIKTGVAGDWGKIKVPTSATTTKYVDLTFDTRSEVISKFGCPILWSLDDGRVFHTDNNVVFVCKIPNLGVQVDAIEEYLVGDNTDVLSAGNTPDKTYDLMYPTSIYTCTESQTSTSRPVWSYRYTVSAVSLTQEMIDVLNSGITAQKVLEIDMKKDIAPSINTSNALTTGYNKLNIYENASISLPSSYTTEEFHGIINYTSGTITWPSSLTFIGDEISSAGTYEFSVQNDICIIIKVL